MSEDGTIEIVAEGPILKIGLSRPAKKNSLTPAMLVGLATAFDRLEAEEALRVGILHGEGGNFTAGLDLMKFMATLAAGEGRVDFPGIDPLQLKARCTKPLVAAVSGIVFTVGIELMLACDVVVAGDDSVFAQLEPARGIMPSGGGTVRWVQQVGWGNAMRYLLTADRFDAAEALRIGLVQAVVPTGEVLEQATALAARIAANAPLALRETKRSALRYLEDGQRVAFTALDEAQGRLIISADAAEGVAAMLERRPPVFRGV